MNGAATTRGGDAPSRVAGLVLAAGGSSRMGRPKQLLLHDGVSLLRRAADAALGGGLDPVVVVLGDRADLMAAELSGLHLRIAINPEWRSGIGSSIRCGVHAIGVADIDAVTILLADQPFATAEIVRRLVAAFRTTGAPIVASEYGGTLGVPALFDRTYLTPLAELSSDRGAKDLIVSAGQTVRGVPFAGGAYDIDTPEDLVRLRAGGGAGRFASAHSFDPDRS